MEERSYWKICWRRSDDDGGVEEEEEVEESRLEEREIPAHFFPRRRNRGFSLLSSSPFLALTPGVNKCNRIGLSLSLLSFSTRDEIGSQRSRRLRHLWRKK